MTTKEAIYLDVIEKQFKEDVGVRKAIDELFNVFKLNSYWKLIYIPKEFGGYIIDNKNQFERIARQHLYKVGIGATGIHFDRLYHTLKVRADRLTYA